MTQCKSKTRGGKGARILLRSLRYLALVALAMFLVFPFYYMLIRSFMPVEELRLRPMLFFTLNFTLDSWKEIFGAGNYLLYTFNTLKIVVINCITIPLAASFTAYGFAKLKFKGRNFLFAFMLGTMMLPGAIMQVPLYVMFAGMNWLNTSLPLIIPGMLGGGAMNVFLFRQFMRGLPKELEEAARVDGANTFIRYAVITLPLCVPIIIYTIVGTFVAGWGDFYGPLLYMTSVDESKLTLAYAVFKSSMYENVGALQEGKRMAAGVFMTLFPALLFFLFQRQLVDGIVMNGIKG